MSHTFVRLTVHAVFSTKERLPLLKAPDRERIWAYMADVINEEHGFAREVGGTDDHVHILFDIAQTNAVADCMRDVKAKSSGWIHRELPDIWGFAWQEGYGAFSVSASLVPRVRRYIQTQERHHRRRSFKDEFLALLDKHGVEYDRRYLWR